jgi:hypothetical protein
MEIAQYAKALAVIGFGLEQVFVDKSAPSSGREL